MTYDQVANGLPTAWGEPLIAGRFKVAPADFIVSEQLGFDLDGHGEHLFLQVRKCGLNTNDVVEILQKQFNCQSVDVGVSGLKDKQAITDQWISIRTPLSLSDTELEPLSGSAQQDRLINLGEMQVLKGGRHNRKLRRGAHQENRFVVRLHDVNGINQTTKNLSFKNDHSALTQAVADRLHIISSHGFPNYFGPQRFGFNQQNLVNAQRYFDNPRKKITRTKRGLYISAARSAIFNRVCAHRVQASSWNTPLNGEPMILDGAQSYFVNTGNDDDTIARCQAFDIHPSGPMWGSGSAIAQSECAQIETEAVSSMATLSKGLESIDLKQQRRALRVRPSNLTGDWLKSDCLELRFGLPVGSYATSLLTELVSIKQEDQSA